jgi:hypothetical protein
MPAPAKGFDMACLQISENIFGVADLRSRKNSEGMTILRFRESGSGELLREKIKRAVHTLPGDKPQEHRGGVLSGSRLV